MSLSTSLLLIVCLIAASAFFSVAEISLAASRRLRLRQMMEDGEPRAELVMKMQAQPGEYFTVTQIGLNAVAILGGVVGEGALTPYLAELLMLWLPESRAQTVGFLLSFASVTSLFILFADQVELLRSDNVVSEAAKAAGLTLEGLGIAPDSLEGVAPQYLWRFRKAGQFTHKSA